MAEQNGNEAFFLDNDEAKSLGDINYMRKSVKVRRTFPKTLKNPGGFEVVKEVSATEGKGVSSNGNSDVPANNSTFNQSKPEVVERRSQDNNMDIFRNMARDIKKR